MVKKAHILAMISLLAVSLSCSKNDSQSALDSHPIGFELPMTKAPVSSLTTNGSSFLVNGKEGSDVIFSNHSVSYNGSSWTYSPTKYWKASKAYSFRAVWPAGAISPATVYTDNLSSDASISTFSIANSPEQQTDLLLSEIANVNTGASVTGQSDVELKFHHLLSNVFIQLCKSGDAVDTDVISVTKVQISGMKNSGTYTGTAVSGTWGSLGSNSQICTKDFGSSPISLTKGTYSSVWENGLLCIPQTLTSGATITIWYKLNGGSEHSIDVSTGSGTVWTQGKQYVYRIALNAAQIDFSLTLNVTPWTDAVSGGIDITPAK